MNSMRDNYRTFRCIVCSKHSLVSSAFFRAAVTAAMSSLDDFLHLASSLSALKHQTLHMTHYTKPDTNINLGRHEYKIGLLWDQNK